MENISKKVLEGELERLTKDYEIVLSRIDIMTKTLSQYKDNAMKIKGAIDQTKNLLALLNNEEKQNNLNKNKEEEKKDGTKN